MNIPKLPISLVLSSGGAKGYAHIGAIKAIEESGYIITSIAGTSMGAMVGGLYAAGKLDEAYEWLKTIDSWEVFKMSDLHNVSMQGLLNGDYIFDRLRGFIGDVLIEDLPIDYCAIATNIDNGNEVVIRKGPLLEAIRMSVSMPVLFAPYKKNGHRYVDGGLTNGLPINRVVRHKGDKLIAIDLDTYGTNSVKDMEQEITSTFFSEKEATRVVTNAMLSFTRGHSIFDTGLGVATGLATPLISNFVKNSFSSSGSNLFRIFFNSFYIALRQNKIAMRNAIKPDYYINIDVKGNNTFSFTNAEEIHDLGYRQVKNALAGNGFTQL